jgi:hypothetical protein
VRAYIFEFSTTPDRHCQANHPRRGKSSIIAK